jgi:hypothetical protein
LYCIVSHATLLEVLNADTGAIVGAITETPGGHGAAIAQDLKRGFTSNGGDKSVRIFDTKTPDQEGQREWHRCHCL